MDLSRTPNVKSVSDPSPHQMIPILEKVQLVKVDEIYSREKREEYSRW